MPIVIVIYVLINVAYLAVLSPAEIIASPAVATDLATKTIGTTGTILVPLCVAASCWGGLNSSMMASSRLFMVGAREKHLPSWFGMITIRGGSGTPAPGRWDFTFYWFYCRRLSHDTNGRIDDLILCRAQCFRSCQLLQFHVLAHSGTIDCGSNLLALYPTRSKTSD